jgi:CheY-like chemotaxis protein
MHLSTETKMAADENIIEEKLLLVDDNPVNLQLLCQMLDKPGRRLLVAKNKHND